MLEEAGFTVEDLREEPNGFTTLAAAKGDLSASFVHTGGPFLGLDVSGAVHRGARGPAGGLAPQGGAQPRDSLAHSPSRVLPGIGRFRS